MKLLQGNAVMVKEHKTIARERKSIEKNESHGEQFGVQYQGNSCFWFFFERFIFIMLKLHI